jgi:hypothetical protein
MLIAFATVCPAQARHASDAARMLCERHDSDAARVLCEHCSMT